MLCAPPALRAPSLSLVWTPQAQDRVRGEQPRYRGLVHALVTIGREEGVRALWKGLLPRLMRIPPGQAITWAVSDFIVGTYERGEIRIQRVL